MLSLKLHKPVKLVMGCSVQVEMRENEEKGEKRIIDGNLLHKRKLKRQVQNKICRWLLSDRLKFDRYIETFNTKRQFTVQYERYCGVTFATQGKVGFWLVCYKNTQILYILVQFLAPVFLHQVHNFLLQASVKQLSGNKSDFLVGSKLHCEHSLLRSAVTSNFKKHFNYKNNICF